MTKDNRTKRKEIMKYTMSGLYSNDIKMLKIITKKDYKIY